MKRRGVTVAVGCVLLIVLVALIGRMNVPYVEMGPGPTFDTLGKSGGDPVITVDGAPTSTSAGQLRLVTVSVASDLTLFDALRGWWRHDYAVLPRDLVYPPNTTQQQVQEQDAEAFKESQTSAETSALRALGYPVVLTVKEVAEGAPAAGVLAKGDVITAVDGQPATSMQKLSSLVGAKEAGTAHSVTFRRGSETITRDIGTTKGPDGKPKLGVTMDPTQPHPFTLKIKLSDVGGPSAGLMFTLGVIDTLMPEDLTGGNIIAGTGTIDDDGVVGPIGGISQKLIGAKRAGVRYFLTPAENCAEAVANKQPDMPLIKVTKLEDGIEALAAIRAHKPLNTC